MLGGPTIRNAACQPKCDPTAPPMAMPKPIPRKPITCWFENTFPRCEVG